MAMPMTACQNPGDPTLCQNADFSMLSVESGHSEISW
jgi:hypothetical protein